jgi:hypothetical protein
MTTEDVAKRVVELVRKQAWYEALDTLYDDNVVSVEAFSMSSGSPETRGKEAVRGKIDWWLNATEVHSFTADGPFVAHDRFVVQYDADVTDKESKTATKIVRGRRLHGEGWKDRARRVPAACRLRFTRCERRIAFGERRKTNREEFQRDIGMAP